MHMVSYYIGCDTRYRYIFVLKRTGRWWHLEYPNFLHTDHQNLTYRENSTLNMSYTGLLLKFHQISANASFSSSMIAN